jgi:hypothetical protein
MTLRGSVPHDLAATTLIATVARPPGNREAHPPTPPAIDEYGSKSDCASPSLVGKSKGLSGGGGPRARWRPCARSSVARARLWRESIPVVVTAQGAVEAGRIHV